MSDSLDTTSFKAAKDQRQALHRWNTYVLGTEYVQEARIRYPRTREYVDRRARPSDRLDVDVGRLHRSLTC